LFLVSLFILEPVESQYIRIGHIARLHGVDGTVLIIPEIDEPSVFENMKLVRLQNSQGDMFPARIESARMQQQNKRFSFFVKFSHIADQNEARELKNMPVFADRDMLDPIRQEQSEGGFISFSARDEKNHEIGTIEDILDNPAHPLLVVRDGDNELLVPFVDEYITTVDEEKSIIYCRNLNQLAEIA
jgi:16S rRNA processing protein RimM